MTSSYYSNTDEKLLKQTVFVVEFDLKCSNKLEVRNPFCIVCDLKIKPNMFILSACVFYNY